MELGQFLILLAVHRKLVGYTDYYFVYSGGSLHGFWFFHKGFSKKSHILNMKNKTLWFHQTDSRCLPKHWDKTLKRLLKNGPLTSEGSLSAVLSQNKDSAKTNNLGGSPLTKTTPGVTDI